MIDGRREQLGRRRRAESKREQREEEQRGGRGQRGGEREKLVLLKGTGKGDGPTWLSATGLHVLHSILKDWKRHTCSNAATFAHN